jgi:hypothetical protein
MKATHIPLRSFPNDSRNCAAHFVHYECVSDTELRLIDESGSLLGYGAVQSCRSRLMFQRCVLPPSSGLSPRNVSLLLRDYMAPYPKRLPSSYFLPCLLG